jgi:hypothetical protein
MLKAFHVGVAVPVWKAFFEWVIKIRVQFYNEVKKWQSNG